MNTIVNLHKIKLRRELFGTAGVLSDDEKIVAAFSGFKRFWKWYRFNTERWIDVDELVAVALYGAFGAVIDTTNTTLAQQFVYVRKRACGSCFNFVRGNRRHAHRFLSSVVNTPDCSRTVFDVVTCKEDAHALPDEQVVDKYTTLDRLALYHQTNELASDVLAELPEIQRVFIEKVLSGKEVKATAEDLGKNERNGYIWLWNFRFLVLSRLYPEAVDALDRAVMREIITKNFTGARRETALCDILREGNYSDSLRCHDRKNVRERAWSLYLQDYQRKKENGEIKANS